MGSRELYLPATTVGALVQYLVRGSNNEKVGIGPATLRVTRSARVARTDAGRMSMLNGECDGSRQERCS